MTILEKQAAVEEMLEDRMAMVASSYLGGVLPSAASIWRALQTAEAKVSRKLGIWLEPVEVFPMNPPTDAELTALAGKPYIVEPGYDMEGGMLGSFQWASIQLRTRPLIKVHSVKFVYPTINTPIYDVPLDWVYPDRKAGLLQFTPKPTSAGLAPSILGASIMARGGAVPQMIRIRYTAGLEQTSQYIPEIVDAIMRYATLSYMKLAPQSSSISGDGLSQSKSVDVDKLGAAIDSDLAGLRERILGVIWSTV